MELNVIQLPPRTEGHPDLTVMAKTSLSKNFRLKLEPGNVLRMTDPRGRRLAKYLVKLELSPPTSIVRAKT